MVNAIAQIHIETPRLTKQGFVAGAATGVAVGGGLVLRIRLRFHNRAPEQVAIGLAFQQQAANELGRNLLSGPGEKGMGEGWEVVDGFGSGFVEIC